MARAPTIAGRPAPQRKHRSSGGSAASTAGPSSTLKGPSAGAGAPRTLVTKAFKRAQKRAQLLARTSESSQDEHAKARALLLTGPAGTVSKSALRRRKRKVRDDIARDEAQGRKGGVGELQSAVAELQDDMASDDEDDYDEAYGQSTSESNPSGRVSAAQRKRVLALEQTRQQAILGDPSFRASPFAALREHARNSMAQQQNPRGRR